MSDMHQSLNLMIERYTDPKCFGRLPEDLKDLIFYMCTWHQTSIHVPYLTRIPRAPIPCVTVISGWGRYRSAKFTLVGRWLADMLEIQCMI
jgi:hypothetical protein